MRVKAFLRVAVTGCGLWDLSVVERRAGVCCLRAEGAEALMLGQPKAVLVAAT